MQPAAGKTNEFLELFSQDNQDFAASLLYHWNTIYDDLNNGNLLHSNLPPGDPLINDAIPVPSDKASKRVKSETVKVMETEEDKELFEKLRSLRTTIAQKYGLPPYVIFHDRTLHELVSYLPQSLDEMHGIHGIGEAKRENYGQQFLEVILEHVKTDGTKDGVGKL